jgi:hypothetical protein
MKLFETNIIEKYNQSVNRMTAQQACNYLGMSWDSFRITVWRGTLGDNRLSSLNKGVPNEVIQEVLNRDHGICSVCSRDMVLFKKILDAGRCSSDPNERLGYLNVTKFLRLSLKSSLWYIEKIDIGEKWITSNCKTMCFLCMAKKTEKNEKPWYPIPVSGGWSSKEAIYNRDDIECLRSIRQSYGKPVGNDMKPKTCFRSYLSRSVHNIFANWCRTRDRRYKELLPGSNPNNEKSWEESIEDLTGPQQEINAELNEVYRSMDLESTQKNIVDLITEGCSISDIVKKLAIPKRKMRNEIRKVEV